MFKANQAAEKLGKEISKKLANFQIGDQLQILCSNLGHWSKFYLGDDSGFEDDLKSLIAKYFFEDTEAQKRELLAIAKTGKPSPNSKLEKLLKTKPKFSAPTFTRE